MFPLTLFFVSRFVCLTGKRMNRLKISSIKKIVGKNFVTGKIIRHFLPTTFLPGYLKTLIELKKKR